MLRNDRKSSTFNLLVTIGVIFAFAMMTSGSGAQAQTVPPGVEQISFGGNTAPEGWTLATGAAFDGEMGWVAEGGETRQCGVRGVESDPVLDSFCHADTRYEFSGGSWSAIASPASLSRTLPDGTYDNTVTVGEAAFHSPSSAHSVRAEGVSIHDAVVTSEDSPFRTSTATVTITDGALDLTFDGGNRTKIVSVVIANLTPPAEPPAPEPPPVADALQFSFGSTAAPAGWVGVAGETFNGEYGWTATDGQRRQCGVRNTNSDPVLDAFCHADTRYNFKDNAWQSVASPASWKTKVENGTYEVTVTVGEALFHPPSVAHSVQVEGVSVHDRVTTDATNPFRTATVTVEVTDGFLDLTFLGGTKTKLVSATIQPLAPPAPSPAPTSSVPATTPTTAPPVPDRKSVV